MGSLVYVAIFLCVVAMGVALIPHPATESGLPKLPVRRVGGVRRGPFGLFLEGLGRIVPRWLGRTVGMRLVYAGSNLSATQFMGGKLLAVLIGVIAGLMVAREFPDFPLPWGGVLGFVAGWIGAEMWLRGKIRRRHEAILRLLPDVIDLLSLCVGAGLDFLGSLNKVVVLGTVRRKKEPLIEELALVLQEIKVGKRRFEALKAMARRVNLPELSSFVRTLVLADRMGTPITEVLSVHSEDFRFQRFSYAERAALKAPIKILAPLVLCILPCVALIVGGPIFIQFMQQSPFGK